MTASGCFLPLSARSSEEKEERLTISCFRHASQSESWVGSKPMLFILYRARPNNVHCARTCMIFSLVNEVCFLFATFPEDEGEERVASCCSRGSKAG